MEGGVGNMRGGSIVEIAFRGSIMPRFKTWPIVGNKSHGVIH